VHRSSSFNFWWHSQKDSLSAVLILKLELKTGQIPSVYGQLNLDKCGGTSTDLADVCRSSSFNFWWHCQEDSLSAVLILKSELKTGQIPSVYGQLNLDKCDRHQNCRITTLNTQAWSFAHDIKITLAPRSDSLLLVATPAMADSTLMWQRRAAAAAAASC